MTRATIFSQARTIQLGGLIRTVENIETRLQHVLNRTVHGKRVFGAVVRIESAANAFVWTSSAGNLALEQPYFIASITKLYTVAILMQLRQQGRLNLDDRIIHFIPAGAIAGIHVYRGVDYGPTITIRQLMAQTSGLADYFHQKGADGKSVEAKLTAGIDRRWTLDDVLNDVRHMRPAFPPDAKGKALYSDTNYQLLGRIIEQITGSEFAQALETFIVSPLGLRHTCLFTNPDDQTPAPLYFKNNPLRVPQAMASFGPDGGMVSTAEESMVFLRAFFEGHLFPKAYLSEMQVWNRIFFPFHYGVGLMRFKLPRIFSPFKAMPELVGHSGLSGAFAFYAPAQNTYLTGTVNQIVNPGLSFRLMLRLLKELTD